MSLQFSPSQIYAFDLLHYSNDEELLATALQDGAFRRPLKDSSVAKWLENPNPPQSTKEPASRLRILMGFCFDRNGEERFRTIPFSKQTFEHLLEVMKVPHDDFVEVLEQQSSLSARFAGVEGQEVSQPVCFLFKIGLLASGYSTIAISYSADTKTTICLLLTQTGNPDRDVLSLPLQMSRHLWSRPMLVPALTAKIVCSRNAEAIDEAHKALDSVESDLGLHKIANRRVGDLSEIRFTEVIATTSINHAALAVSEMRLKSLLLLLEAVSDNEKLINSLSANKNQESREGMEFKRLLEMVENLEARCKSLLLRTENDQKRAETMLSVISAYMTQRVEAWNMRIATASKLDSSAASSIALLTMTVLPATFVATLFAMPLFNWDANPDESVFKPRFSTYWKVVVPLTAAVLLLWVLWTGWQIYQSERNLKKELKKVELEG